MSAKQPNRRVSSFADKERSKRDQIPASMAYQDMVGAGDDGLRTTARMGAAAMAARGFRLDTRRNG